MIGVSRTSLLPVIWSQIPGSRVQQVHWRIIYSRILSARTRGAYCTNLMVYKIFKWFTLVFTLAAAKVLEDCDFRDFG